jgi:hypothetical protein
MSMPRDTRDPLRDVTNITGTFAFHIYVQICKTFCDGLLISTLDEEVRKRKERNRQQRKRRAEMTTEQREEANRKQREYRARKKAASQNISTMCGTSETSPIGGGTSSLHYFHLHHLF